MSNPDKPNLEAALSSTPVAAKKSRFRPTFRSPRIPRETKLGLGIIFSLVCVFGYVLYSRLTRPAEMDAEQFAAQSKSVLAPSVTSDQPTALAPQPHSLAAQPAGHQPTVLPGAAPEHAMPVAGSSVPTQYGAPTNTAGQTAWAPNSSNTATATPSSDPFMNRSTTKPESTPGAAASFSANGFGANNSTAANTTTGATAPNYGLSDSSDSTEGPRNSFLPPADRATTGSPTSGTASLNATVTSPETTATASTPASSSENTLSKTASDSLNQLKQEGQNLANAGTAVQNEVSKAGDSASQMLNQAQQQFGQYTNAAANNANTMLNQAGQAATQYGADLKKEVQTQASQYTNQLQNTAQNQFQQAQNELRANANSLVNDTTNQLRTTTESVISKTNDSTQNLLKSATTALNGGQPLSPLPTTSATAGSTQPTGYGMPSATAPRTLDQSQTVSQPLNAASNIAGYSTTQPEQPIRIPTENGTQPITQPASTAQPNYGTAPAGMSQPNYAAPSATATNPNYGSAATPNYGTAPTVPNYGTMPATNGASTAPATSGTPLQFNPPSVPASQPTTQPFAGATRTNFEQPAASTSAASRGGVQQYTVTAQDSYYSVAEKMYGNGALNKALYEYNRRNNPAADRLQVGGAMLIPDLGTLQAQFPDLVPSAPATATINPTPLQFPR